MLTINDLFNKLKILSQNINLKPLDTNSYTL